jgi:hypothetical protein
MELKLENYIKSPVTIIQKSKDRTPMVGLS